MCPLMDNGSDGNAFSLYVPNAETKKAIVDGRAGKGVTVHKSLVSFRESLRSL